MGKIIVVLTELDLENEMNRLSVFTGTAEVITLATKRLALGKNLSFKLLESWNNFLEASSWMFSVVSVESQSEVCPVKLGQLCC